MKIAWWFDRIFPIPGLIATIAIAFTLLGLHVTGWRGSEELANFVTNDRTTVAIVVQILSHVLGLIQAQALCTVLRLSLTDVLSRRTTKGFSLDLLQFVHAASIPRVSHSLPWYLSLPLVGLVLFTFLPAALWSGAITPILAERVVNETMRVPSFQTTDPSSLWQVGPSGLPVTSGSGTLGQWLTKDGLFSFDPSALRSLILNSASNASSSQQQQHQKLDKTGFSFVGRSYGVGAAVGLVDVVGTSSSRWTVHPERGFDTQVSCIHNASAAYGLNHEQVPDGAPWIVSSSNGTFPDSKRSPAPGSVYLGYLNQDIFSWSAGYLDGRRAYVVAATGATLDDDEWFFHDFADLQCSIDFRARMYSVHANYTSRLISVTPEKELPWPDYADEVARRVAYWLLSFSFVDSCAGGSYLGRTLRLNLNQLQRVTGDSSPDTVLRGVSDYLTSCVDDTLIALSGARLVAANAATAVQASVALSAVTLGDATYIYAILALNLAICLIYSTEAARMRLWRDVPALDVMDLTSVVVAAWKGGVVAVWKGGSALVGEREGTPTLNVAWPMLRDDTARPVSSDPRSLEASDHCRSNDVSLFLGDKTQTPPSLVPLVKAAPTKSHSLPSVVPLVEGAPTTSSDPEK